ncbi:hypothetical protein MXB_2644 [Myxobolus squamalis]|nr:hypothetical protein MXB_2644 [Myxobolus squamalis]
MIWPKLDLIFLSFDFERAAIDIICPLLFNNGLINRYKTDPDFFLITRVIVEITFLPPNSCLQTA